MRFLLLLLSLTTAVLGSPLDEFITAAKAKHGAAGEKAARFLVEHMSSKDKAELSQEFLMENLELAFKARTEFTWAQRVPEDLFLNDVLPYAVFDETREAWRAEFLEMARPLVKDAPTATEAAQILNREFFNLIEVHYDTGRKRPNQSPSESRVIKKATCTGLSIILVDACRAVGIPARAVGTPLWTNERGNHTWVEIWDDGWHFTGADEYDEKGLNRGWFVNDAAQAKVDDPRHAIYATSWQHDRLAFPMVWAPINQDVAAVNVTDRYAKAANFESLAMLGVRLSERGEGDRRIAAKGWLIAADGEVLETFETKASPADLNDLPTVPVSPGSHYRLRFEFGGKWWESAPFAAAEGQSTRDFRVDTLTEIVPPQDRPAAEPAASKSLTRDQASRLIASEFQRRVEEERDERQAEVESKTIAMDGKVLRWLEKSFGDAPPAGRSLWISMHGGGGAPARVNDQQWRNQIELYQPEEGIYLAPRAPTDTWNLWHEPHIDLMFQRLIESYVMYRGVNPNKIYLMGYSAGGDGVWQLAPRMADRFAAAAMMAGHPNEASLLGLRNLPFGIFMGGEDAAYERNKIAALKTAELKQLAKDNPGGYVHLSRIYDGTGHWMNRQDAEALPWMAAFARNPWPKTVIWLQDDVTHDRFYWLKIAEKAAAKAGQKIAATVEGQTIRLEGDVPPNLELRLSDELLDLDQEVKVFVNGNESVTTMVPRTAEAIRTTLEERADPAAAAAAVLVVP